MTYRIFFHEGSDLDFRTKVKKGRLSIDKTNVTILHNLDDKIIPLINVEGVKVIRLHKIARVVRLDHKNGTIFLSAVRFMIGQFCIVNFFATGEILERINDAIGNQHITAKPSENGD